MGACIVRPIVSVNATINGTELEVAGISAASPDMADADFAALRESIRTLGQLVPIVLHRGEVIDGRKRLAACRALGIEPQTITLADEADPAENAIALNLLRQHYSPSQRAAFVSTLATLTKADASRMRHALATDNCPLQSDRPPTVAEAGAMAGVSGKAVARAKRVRRDGALEVIAAVERGDLTLHAAEAIIDSVPKGEQPAVVVRVVAENRGNRNVATAKILGKPPQTNRHPLLHKRRHVKAADIIERATHTLEGVALAFGDLEGLDELDPTKRAEWADSLAESMRTIGRVVKELRHAAGTVGGDERTSGDDEEADDR